MGSGEPGSQRSSRATDVSTSGAGSGGGSSLPSRPLSYSPFWKLLATAIEGSGVVALWDTRMAGAKGPAVAVGVGGGSDAAWVHIDEGQGGAGHLLLTPAGGSEVPIGETGRGHDPKLGTRPKTKARFA